MTGPNNKPNLEPRGTTGEGHAYLGGNRADAGDLTLPRGVGELDKTLDCITRLRTKVSQSYGHNASKLGILESE